MATVEQHRERVDQGLSRREKAELAWFERCQEIELVSLSPEALARYRSLMLRYACTARGRR